MTVGVMAVRLVPVGIVTPLKNKLDIRKYNAVHYDIFTLFASFK